MAANSESKKITDNPAVMIFLVTFVFIGVIFVLITVLMAICFFAVLLAALNYNPDVSSGVHYSTDVNRDVLLAVERVNSTTIFIEDLGGHDNASLTYVQVMVGQNEIYPVSGEVTSRIGSKAYYHVDNYSSVEVMAIFNDDSSQVLWDDLVY